MSAVEKFYSGKSVLVTGVTGFVGKALVEKLLRGCPSIATIFVLVRTKRNANPEERFKKIIDHAIFDELRKTNPNQLTKLKYVCGDISEENLGISEADRLTLIENVELVFHSAALVAFELSLLEILKTNGKGTQRVLELAQQMKSLKAFTFVSTAFSQSYQNTVEEREYVSGFDPHAIMKSIDENNTTAIKSIEECLFLKDHPSTYTMSKAIAENLVCSFQNTLPIVIVRPSIIVSAYAEPVPGFVEGFQASNGVVAAGMSGINIISLADGRVEMKIIPIDFTVNTIIAAAYKKALTVNDKNVEFYNSTTSETNPTTWKDLITYCLAAGRRFPLLEKLAFYPNAVITSNVMIYSIIFLLLQILPSLVLDAVIILSGRKPFFTKAQTKIFNLMISFKRFSCVSYDISIANTQKLFKELSSIDQQKFMFDVDEINWPQQLEDNVKGIRKFVFKESDDNLPEALEKLKKLYWIDLVIKVMISLSLLYFGQQMVFSLSRLVSQ